MPRTPPKGPDDPPAETLQEPHSGSSIALDELDLAILRCLHEDGRMHNLTIGKAAGTTESTVRRRLQRLQDSGVLRVVPVIEPEKIGLNTALFMGLRIAPGTSTEVSRAIAAIPAVRYVAVTTGPFDMLVEAFVGHKSELARLILDTIGNIPNVQSTETMTVLRVAKFTYEWEVPPEHSALR